MHIDLYVAAAGLIVGFAVGLTGMGGGSLMTPILILLFGVQPIAAVSSDLVASLMMKPFGAAVHLRKHTVNWPLVLWLSAGSVPGALAGVFFLHTRGRGAAVQSSVQVALGIVLLASVTAVGIRWALERGRGDGATRGNNAPQVHAPRTLVIGAVVGFIVGVTSTGSGTLVVVMLLLLYPQLRGSQVVGTDITQAVPMVGAAALGHILFGDFRLGVTLSIVIGSIPGVLIGSSISAGSGTVLLRVALCTTLLVSGLKLLSVPPVGLGAAVLVLLVGLLVRWRVNTRVDAARRCAER
ncbi:MAG: sulfite exporter TauE/SafE family protein [Candidatus Dormibacteraeota bacterium]|uniref:Probable membrane transporter protein n=1 Tax=Candidatus Amunia macphersoniae TaxID=3127014 RepID=A0A934NIN1_9BACT|nr:sulfite exporter TauE/SafE family protein [Candidatus Dormibacteraeota bacterium]